MVWKMDNKYNGNDCIPMRLMEILAMVEQNLVLGGCCQPWPHSLLSHICILSPVISIQKIKIQIKNKTKTNLLHFPKIFYLKNKNAGWIKWIEISHFKSSSLMFSHWHEISESLLSVSSLQLNIIYKWCSLVN